MIESTDYLLEKHFNRTLADRNVEILDPATGTGTFVAELIEHIPSQYLAYKFEHEIHANEVAILPYYIANLNIEYTYQQKIGAYKEFRNICFVDTLDNTAALNYQHKQGLMFGISSENAARIKNQNERKISVIIGNPPYNANQANFNDFNRNRDYQEIDRRIKDTFVKNSTAQKTKVYDMYARFYRWAMDRIDENGVIAFITNRSFIDSRTFDGFRKNIEDDFDFAYIVDTRSDVRANPKIAGTSHNVFGIQTGVAVMFLVKTNEAALPPDVRKGSAFPAQGKKDSREAEPRAGLVSDISERQSLSAHLSGTAATRKCRIHYVTMDDFWRKEEKLEWFEENSLSSLPFDRITPDKQHNWINMADNDFENLLPLIDKDLKLGRKTDGAIFRLFSLGVATNRDDWVYSFSREDLINKMSYFSKTYNKLLSETGNEGNVSIKWSRDLKQKFSQEKKIDFASTVIVKALYKPYTHKFFFANRMTSDVFTQNHISFFGNKFDVANPCIGYIGKDTIIPFSVLAFNTINDLNSLSNAAGGSKTFPLYVYDANGERHDNITDWGLQQFRAHYNNKRITREDIFHYTYAVLHHPAYRRKYELNLKREFPRLPFYTDFRQWAAWGKDLMMLHINYETAKPFKLKRVETETNAPPRPKLKADKLHGEIELDSETVLRNVLPLAWEYKLGNRSALEWILDQYKEKKPSDATIAEKFNTYRFADYKEHVIDLLKRVCTVSVKTMEIINQMPKAD